MVLRLWLIVAALASTPSNAQNQTTWVVTSHITEKYTSRSTIKYGSTEVIPLQRSTTLEIESSYISETPTSRDTTVTHWITEQTTLPVLTLMSPVYTTLSTPISVTSNGTSTITRQISPILATVTLLPTACASTILPANSTSPTNGTSATNSTLLIKAVTEYTGTYIPFPGQVTTTPTAWPTAVTTYITITDSYRLFTYVGNTVTVTSTVTGKNWLSTTTISENRTVTVAPFRYTNTVYLNTVTVTNSDWQLIYTTKSAPTACPETPTVTRAMQCAPTNLIAERDGHGTTVQLLPLDWRFPIGFPDTLIGIPGMDASACCQLCLDNPGCAASEWTVSWPSGCRLFYYGRGNDTCGGGTTLEYYGDSYEFPRQAGFVQAGCGQLRYSGVKNPFCPTCEVSR